MTQYHSMHHVGHPHMNMTYPPAEATHQEVLDDPGLFKMTLNRLLTQMGIKLKIPKIGGQEVDLHLLYKEVTKLGGVDSVIARKQWVIICEPFNFPESFTNKSFVIKKLYVNGLHHYEQVVFHRNTGRVVPAPSSSSGDPPGVPGYNYYDRMKHGRPEESMWGYQQAQPGPTTGYYGAGGGGHMMPGMGLQAHHLQTGVRFSGTVESTFENGYNLSLELANGQRIQGTMYRTPASHGGNQYHVDSAVVTGSEHVHQDHHAMHVECNSPRMQQHKRVRAASPDGEDLSHATAKLAGDGWNDARFEERQPYVNKADADHQLYKTETARLAGQVVTSYQRPNADYALEAGAGNSPQRHYNSEVGAGSTPQRHYNAEVGSGNTPQRHYNTEAHTGNAPQRHYNSEDHTGNSSRAVSCAATGIGAGPQDPPVTPLSTHCKPHPFGTGAGGGEQTLNPFQATPNSDHAHYPQGPRKNNMRTDLQPLPPSHPMAAALNAAHQRAVAAALSAGAPPPPPPHMLGVLLGLDVGYPTSEAFGDSTAQYAGGHDATKHQHYYSGSDHGENNSPGTSPMADQDKYLDKFQHVPGPLDFAEDVLQGFNEQSTLLEELQREANLRKYREGQEHGQGGAHGSFGNDESEKAFASMLEAGPFLGGETTQGLLGLEPASATKPSEPKPAVNACDSKAVAAGFGNGGDFGANVGNGHPDSPHSEHDRSYPNAYHGALLYPGCEGYQS